MDRQNTGNQAVRSHTGAGNRELTNEETVGGRIRAVRRRAGLTQEEFARALAYSKRALISWETGSADPPMAILPSLRRLYNIDLEWMVMGDGTIEDPIPSRRTRSRNRAVEPDSGQLCLFEEVANGAAPESIPPALPAVLGGVMEHVAALA